MTRKKKDKPADDEAGTPGEKFVYTEDDVAGLTVDNSQAEGPPLGEDWLREHGYIE